MAHHSQTLGIDFGTSNSAAGFLEGDRPRLIEMAPGEHTIPTTFFFDFETRKTLIGDPANQALLDGIEGRFMRALKRVLGTTLIHEPRQILNESVTLADIIARFLAQLKDRAETETGRRFDKVLSGRPVVFHGASDPREAQAEADLRRCYLAAGFEEVSFMAEPEAAAIASGATSAPGQIGLIVDIGGGTSDFSLFEATSNGVSILANHGVRVGGTDFDRAISLETVMPELGKGGQLRREMGPGTTPVPNAIYNDLATWEAIPFVYTAQNRRMVKDMVHLALDTYRLKRLETVLEHELGHDLAFAVERGKIAANSGHPGVIDLGEIERGLTLRLTEGRMNSGLRAFSDALRSGALETLQRANTPPSKVDRVVYVGGSSLMRMVQTATADIFPDARHDVTEVFTVVADGLAMAAGR